MPGNVRENSQSGKIRRWDHQQSRWRVWLFEEYNRWVKERCQVDHK